MKVTLNVGEININRMVDLPNKKTKAELETLARANGVELDLRKKKASLVKEARASFQQK